MKIKTLFVGLVLGAFLFPILPVRAEVLVEEGMRDFSCADVGRQQKLRFNPVTGELSTQAERRRMIETRSFVCAAYALAEAVPLVTEADGKPAKEVRHDLLQSFPLAARVYVNRTVKTLNGEKPVYVLDKNPAYVWEYPAKMMSTIWNSLTKRDLFSLEHLSQEVFNFLKGKEQHHIHAGKEGSHEAIGALNAGQTFFAEPITEVQKVALEKIERLHQEASDTILCQAKTGHPCEGGRPLAVIAAEHDQATLEGDVVGLPRIVAFARGVNWDMPYKQLCITVKRVDHAHHLWMEGVLNGHNPEGFKQSWTSGLAHALLHFERRTGFAFNGSDNEEFKKIVPEIRELLRMPIEGCN